MNYHWLSLLNIFDLENINIWRSVKYFRSENVIDKNYLWLAPWTIWLKIQLHHESIETITTNYLRLTSWIICDYHYKLSKTYNTNQWTKTKALFTKKIIKVLVTKIYEQWLCISTETVILHLWPLQMFNK